MTKAMDVAGVHEQFVQAVLTTGVPLAEQARLLQQADELPFYWLRTAYHKAKKQSLYLVVHLAQQGTMLLLNHLHASLQKKSSEFHQDLQARLTRFIHYLKKNYQPYFDTRASMPDNIWQAVKKQIDALLEPGEATVLQQADDELATLLRNQYHTGTGAGAPSYHLADYWLKLAENMQQALPGNDVTLRIIYSLVSCNFNNHVFVKWLLCRFVFALPAGGNANDHWAGHLQQLNRIVDMPGMCFDTEAPSCKEMLFADINHEIRATGFIRQSASLLQKPVSFKTKLPAPQLALFYRLQVDLEIITIENKHELMQQLEQIYQTPDGSPSHKRLKDKYYNIEPSAIDAMKTYAIGMINLLRKYEA